MMNSEINICIELFKINSSVFKTEKFHASINLKNVKRTIDYYYYYYCYCYYLKSSYCFMFKLWKLDFSL